MISESECGDNTDSIRRLKHSVLIRDDIRKLESFKLAHKELRIQNPDQFGENARVHCFFLYQHYTDIFNKVIKDELDLIIMSRILMVLKLIEDGNVDQHEGSVMVGKLLKEMYIDAATRRMDNTREKNGAAGTSGDAEDEKEVLEQGKDISWREFKRAGSCGGGGGSGSTEQEQQEEKENVEEVEDEYSDMPPLIAIEDLEYDGDGGDKDPE